jgi:hypothetical protein
VEHTLAVLVFHSERTRRVFGIYSRAITKAISVLLHQTTTTTTTTTPNTAGHFKDYELWADHRLSAKMMNQTR